MKLASESELIAALTGIFAASDPDLLVGIGDDGAVLKLNADTNHNLVVAADMAVEEVHFKRNWSSLHEIGAKITAANLADIFAMGGRPKYLLVNAGLSPDIGAPEISELANGILSEASKVGAKVVGGDISKSEKLVISISAFGEIQRPTLRSGAKVGDKVIISGLTGRSAGGLAQLQSGNADSPLIRQHKRPDVNYELAANFKSVNSMCDVSDGLISELGHIASASSVGIELDAKLLANLPGFIELSEAAKLLNADVWSWVLTGGEDHEFVATTNVDIPSGGYLIGKVVAGSEVNVLGIEKITGSGFRHF